MKQQFNMNEALELKEFINDLKFVYWAISKEAAEVELDGLKEKWGSNIL